MNEFKLDERLEQDTFPLGEFTTGLCLLMNNAHFPWFVYVPFSTEIEVAYLSRQEQKALLDIVNKLTILLKDVFHCDKVNIGAIGNIVSQLHVHVIGRYRTDPCWPGVVWGSQIRKPYSTEDIEKIKNQMPYETLGLTRRA